MDADRLTSLVERLVLNPFGCAPEEREEDERSLSGRGTAAALGEALRRGDISFAEKLLLAVGRLQAKEAADNPKLVLPASTLNPSVAARLPRRRGDYLRLCMAAARCEAELQKILGTSDALRRVRGEVWTACFGRSLYHALFLERVARDDDVLILGETGTGKEGIATSLLAGTLGPQSGGPAPHATINAAALPETLVESELFGYVKGAFTGATETRSGRILSADGGCFFLDEVGDLPAPTQVKLLRVLESDEISPLGSDEAYRADIRFVAATHRDLEEMVAAKEFRPDLYQRLAGNIIRLPPLRDRPEDIPVIGMAFVHALVPQDALSDVVHHAHQWLTSTAVMTYPWPGNVRELQNTLRGVLLGVTPRMQRKLAVTTTNPDTTPPEILAGTATMEQVSDWYLTHVLQRHDNNLAQTARILDVDRSTVRRHLKRIGR